MECGVHKAPANELIRGAIGLERLVDDAKSGDLDAEGVNVLRIFPGRARPVVWGARTTAPREVAACRYVHIRRLLLFVEESIAKGVRWAVLEPNDAVLRKKLQRTIDEFLSRLWRAGPLFGDTPQEAFYVRIDEGLNLPSVASGRVAIEIGIAPVRPAEFIVLRIGMWAEGCELTESGGAQDGCGGG